MDSGYLVFTEGSSIDSALKRHMTALESEPTIASNALTANSSAGRLLVRLQQLGYYVGLEEVSDQSHGGS